MKMLKTYWLELLFFAVGLVGRSSPCPSCRKRAAAVQGTASSRTGPKWAVFIIPVVQLLVCYGFHWWIGRCLEKLPPWPAPSGMERLLPAVLSIILLTLELCVLLAAWGVTIPLGAVLLVELLLVPIVFIGFVAAKILGNIGKLK
ncbi:MAG: hypothetical protein ACLRSY_02805 [Acutalibacter sp.]